MAELRDELGITQACAAAGQRARRPRRHPPPGRPPHRQAPSSGALRPQRSAPLRVRPPGGHASRVSSVPAGRYRQLAGAPALRATRRGGEAARPLPPPRLGLGPWPEALATSRSLVMTSTKRPGSASSHEWLPSTTVPAVPTAVHMASNDSLGMMPSRLAHHRDREATAIELLQLGPGIRPIEPYSRPLPRNQGCGPGWGKRILEDHQEHPRGLADRPDVRQEMRPQSHSGRSAIGGQHLPPPPTIRR